MDSTQSTNIPSNAKQLRWDRSKISLRLESIRLDLKNGKSLNQAARDNTVPRSTAQNWSRNRSRLEQQSGLAPATVEFFRITPRARVPT
ncbi:hypothetical protein SH449x_000270 [Pirellulaceae bacterium SH449]